MSFKKTIFGVKPTPSVDLYSSRGPSNNCPFVLKPDITALGTSILAAWPTNVHVLDLGTFKVFNKFNLISGTSMACPHVAGIALLLKGAHVDWSPTAIRSAIMTTSDIIDNTTKLMKDIGKGNKIATLFALGAGHANKSVFGSASTPLKNTSGSFKSENLQFQRVWLSFSKSILISKSNSG
ncbi:putative tripeptidyl-peptidase II [Medicago truncatula]|uniref:Putative tripeptidyl-peptidase II n=1 Tax=Medicago truncatula TaxID=3880 RepID=G7JWS5_MEDTR|nr:subtilisin-like serine protease [Medicago truncatula]RHN55536.1 putative tripeptidyl-peptidase II [Medicago truncatula]